MPNVLEMKSVFHMVFNAFPITKTIRSDVKQVFLQIFFVPCSHMLGTQAVIPHHAVLNIKKKKAPVKTHLNRSTSHPSAGVLIN